MRFKYDEDIDALYIELRENALVARSVRVDRGTLVDVDEHGQLVGVEVLRPARDWPLTEILERYVVGEPEAQVLRSLWGGRSFESHPRYPFAEPSETAV